MTDAKIVIGVTSRQVDEAIAAALRAYADAEAAKHPDLRQIQVVLTETECHELARVARQAINRIGCVVCQLVNE